MIWEQVSTTTIYDVKRSKERGERKECTNVSGSLSQKGRKVRFCDFGDGERGRRTTYLGTLLVANVNLIRWINHFNVTRPYIVQEGQWRRENGKCWHAHGKRRERTREENWYFCVKHVKGCVSRCDHKGWGNPWLCLDDGIVYYQKQTTEPKRLKGQGTSRNAKKLKFLYTSAYTCSIALYTSLYLPFPLHVCHPLLNHPHVRSDKVDVTQRKKKIPPSDKTAERGAYKSFMNDI